MKHPFPKALQKRLWPMLRSEGFSGSGATLRRLRSPLIHVVNIQGSSSGRQCYLNLGAHLDFLPSEGGLSVTPEKFSEAHCAFRGRIDPPARTAFGWAYLDDPAAAAESIELAAEAWALQGRPFFEKYSGFPETLRRLVLDCTPSNLHARTALTYAHIALHIGESDRAAELARSGLAGASVMATGFRADVKKLLAKIEGGPTT